MKGKIIRTISFYETLVGGYQDERVVQLGKVITKNADEKTIMKEIAKKFGSFRFMLEPTKEIIKKYEMPLEEFMKHATLVDTEE